MNGAGANSPIAIRKHTPSNSRGPGTVHRHGLLPRIANVVIR